MGTTPLRHFVYELLDPAGKVLYVGRTSDVMRRYVQHRQKPWGNRLESVRVYPCTSERKAIRLEADKIRELDPPFNRDGGSSEPERKPTCRTEILDLLEQHGPMTSTDIREAMNQAGSHNSDQVSTIITRMEKRGDVRVVGHRSAERGYYQQTRIFAAAPHPG